MSSCRDECVVSAGEMEEAPGGVALPCVDEAACGADLDAAEGPANFAHITFWEPGGAGEAARAFGSSRRGLGARRAAGRARRLEGEEAAFVSWLCEAGGIRAERYRGAALGRRVSACVRAVRAKTLAEAQDKLMRDPGLVPVALRALLIGVTDFFRDAVVFENLREHLAPLAESRGGVLDVWSAACSDGAELYSVAMVLRDLGLLRGARLTGTDCRRDAIAAAAAGWFTAGRAGALAPELRERSFEPKAGGYLVREELRAACRWEIGDILAGAGPERVDLLLCRNMAIYLEQHAARELWMGLVRRIRPGGILVVGKAERPQGCGEMVRIGPCLYRKAEVSR